MIGGVSSDANAVTACRSCGSAELHPILSLGDTPVANELVDPAAYPATTVITNDGRKILIVATNAPSVPATR